jgi:SAM-dependent methyltransferase
MLSVPAGASPQERAYLQDTLARANPPSLEQVWQLMDRAWMECGCDERAPTAESLQRFYRHPVWLLNGLFVEQDGLSRQIRERICAYISSLQPRRILDYGGGYGTMSRMLADRLPDAVVHLFEPHAGDAALQACAGRQNLHVTSQLEAPYDVIIALDVLEHVTDPLATVDLLSQNLRQDGHFVAGNCFFPVIRCHLPGTFHLRLTFRPLLAALGFRRVGLVDYVEVYRKRSQRRRTSGVRMLEHVSRAAFPVLRPAVEALSRIKKQWRQA